MIAKKWPLMKLIAGKRRVCVWKFGFDEMSYKLHRKTHDACPIASGLNSGING